MERRRFERGLSSEDIRQTRRTALDMGLDASSRTYSGNSSEREVRLERVVAVSLEEPTSPPRRNPLIERIKTIFSHH